MILNRIAKHALEKRRTRIYTRTYEHFTTRLSTSIGGTIVTFFFLTATPMLLALSLYTCPRFYTNDFVVVIHCWQLKNNVVRPSGQQCGVSTTTSLLRGATPPPHSIIDALSSLNILSCCVSNHS